MRKLGLPDPSVLTPSGKAIGGGDLPPMWCPFPMIPPWNPTMGAQMAGPSSQNLSTPIDERRGGNNEDVEEEEDVINLLEDSEALEFVEFDPMVEMPTMWCTTSVMLSVFEKHFNRCLTDDERLPS